MLSRIFLINQGKCCGLKCLMCPYENKHLGISSRVRAEVWNELADWEKKELNDLINKNKVK